MTEQYGVVGSDVALARRRIRALGLFDAQFYMGQCDREDLAVAARYPTLLDHYLAVGWRIGLNPSRLFSVQEYLTRHPDVAAADIEPLTHYVLRGRTEGRAPRLGLEDPRVLAFYLPQFHTCDENDEWWGKGFTEWTNVTRARPFYHGHEQPVLPADLGYYDLRQPQARAAQATLAGEYGVDAFCYYYYWFGGRRLLHEPLDEVLRSGEPDFPFCICWANENWTRRWDGKEDDILIAQDHTLASDYSFIYDVLETLADPRYVRVDGEPLLVVYRADLLHDPRRLGELWREVAHTAGLGGLHLAAVHRFVEHADDVGFDSLVEFPPHSFPAPLLSEERRNHLSAPMSLKMQDYETGVANAVSSLRTSESTCRFRSAMPSWDNTARRMEQALVFHGATPELFRFWMTALLLGNPNSTEPLQDRLVFVNAWNEWAEGAILEPTQSGGRQQLEAIGAARRAVAAFRATGERDPYLELIEWLGAIDDCVASREDPVVLVGHDAQPAGAQVALLRIGEGLKSIGRVPFYVLYGDGALLENFDAIAPTLRAFRFEAELGMTREAVDALLCGLLQNRINLPIVCNTVVSAHFGSAARLRGLRTILYLHELPTSIEMYVGRDRLREQLRDLDVVVTVSEFVREHSARALDLDPASILVNHGPPPDSSNPISRDEARKLLRDRHGIPTDRFMVLGTGAVHSRKGVDVFVATALRALAVEPDIVFVWCGEPQDDSGYLDWVRHDVRTAGVEAAVHFVGHQDDMQTYFVGADCFALTSREDPFPLVALEAFAAGLPGFMFDGATGATELAGPMRELVVPYLDVSAMAERIVALRRNEPMRRALSRSVHDRLNRRFSLEAHVAGFNAVLEAGNGQIRQADVDAARERVGVRIHESTCPVSVIIPFYNHGEFIETTVESVLSQTQPPAEIVIVDDGSRREDRDVAEAVAARCDRVSFVVRENRGAAETINECIKRSSSEFVSILNSDDAYSPDRLERLTQTAEALPEYDVFATEVAFISDGGDRFDQGAWYRAGWDRLDQGMPLWLALSWGNFLMTTSNLFFRRDLIPRIGGFREYRYCHDMEFLQRWLLRGDIFLVREELVDYRFHAANTIREDLANVRAELAEIFAATLTQRVRRPSTTLDDLAAFAAAMKAQGIAGAVERRVAALVGATTGSRPDNDQAPDRTSRSTSVREALDRLDESTARLVSALGADGALRHIDGAPLMDRLLFGPNWKALSELAE